MASNRGTLGRPDIFTFFSSTLALSAAIVDSARKEARNKQWDRVIGETRAEVESAELDQQRRIAYLAEVQEQSKIEGYVPSEIPIRYITFPRSRWADLLSWARIQEEERASAGFQDWRGVPLGLLQRLSEVDLQQLLSDKRVLHRFYGGSDCLRLVADAPSWTLSKKKLRTMEWSVLKLVLRLLLHSSRQSRFHEPQPTANAVSRLLSRERVQWQGKVQDADRRLTLLFSEDEHSSIYANFPSPEAPRYDYSSPGKHDEELMESNVALQAVLGELAALSTDRISKVCAHLLLLRVAPNIHTYNLLLVRFCQLREDALVLAVLDSMRESHIRPNEITHATILRFFTITNDKEGFRLYIEQMSGLRQGLALAHPERDIHPVAVSRYRRFGLHKHKLAEKARMNSEVYSSAIVGLLKMFGRGEAMRYYGRMVNEGWKPTIETLTALLQDCYDLADIVSGVKVWEYIQALRDKGTEIGKVAYECMLRLCDRCKEEVLYQQILNEGICNNVLTPERSDARNHIMNLNCEDGAVSAATNSCVITIKPSTTQLQMRYRNIPTRVLNETLRRTQDDDKLDERLHALDQACKRQRKLQRLTAKLETTYYNLSSDIADLTQAVSQSLPLGDVGILKYGVIAKVTSSDRRMVPKVVQRAYDNFQKMAERQAVQKTEKIGSWARSNYQDNALPAPWLGTLPEAIAIDTS
ncbi:MAG: hypothetical protein Q9163_003988 [Psora crenata]